MEISKNTFKKINLVNSLYQTKKKKNMLPTKQGLYDPQNEHDNCGAGFICSLKGEKTNDIIHKALDILCVLEHRGAVSSDGITGDGAGILIEIPHDFFVKNCDFWIKVHEQI